MMNFSEKFCLISKQKEKSNYRTASSYVLKLVQLLGLENKSQPFFKASHVSSIILISYLGLKFC